MRGLPLHLVGIFVQCEASAVNIAGLKCATVPSKRSEPLHDARRQPALLKQKGEEDQQPLSLGLFALQQNHHRAPAQHGGFFVCR